MKNETLTLAILECFLKYKEALSIKDLSWNLKVSEKRIKYILQVSEKREYVIKDKKTGKYMLTKKIVMLI